MYKVGRKLLAFSAMLGIITSSVSSLSTEAVGTLSGDPSSEFAYDLAVEGTVDGQIKVTFYTTYNPGVNTLGIALRYDADNLKLVKKTVNSDYSSSLFTGVTANNADVGLVTYVAVTQFDINSQPTDYEGDVYISYFFNVKDDSVSSYDFSASVYSYTYLSENISFDNKNNMESLPDDIIMEAVKKGVYTRRIGDVDPDSIVQLEDAVTILDAVSLCSATGFSTSTRDINTAMTCGISSVLPNGNSVVWRERFKDTLYANDIAFAEVADCDQNGLIEKEDANAVLDYYAKQSAAQDPESLIINTEVSKIVYAEITL
jgi:hypothetical protein